MSKEEFTSEEKEFVRDQLAWTAEFLHMNCGMSLSKARKLIRQMQTSF